MTKDEHKTKAQLIAELDELRARVANQTDGTASDALRNKQETDTNRRVKRFIEKVLDAQLDTFFLFEPATSTAVSWNRAFRDISGYTDEEIAHLPAPDSYYSSEDLRRAVASVEEVLEKGAGTIELDLICKDGRKIPTEYRVSVIRDEQGEPTHIISIGRDMTERKRVEEKQRINDERFRSLMQHTAEGFYLFEPPEPVPVDAPVGEQIPRIYSGKIVDCNDAMARMYGHSKAEDVVGMTLAEAHGGADQPENITSIKAWIESGYRMTGSLSSEVDRDGNPVWFSNNVIGVVEDRHLVRAWGTQIDVTEAKKSESRLQQLTAILEATSDLVATAHPNGQITYMNRAGRRLLGWNADEDIRLRKIPDVHPEWAFRIVEGEGIPAAIQSGNWDGETAILGHGGYEIPVSQTIMAHKDAEGELQYLSTIMRDISGQKRAEKTLERERDRAQKYLDVAGVMFVVLDAQGNVVLMNQKGNEILGYEKDEIIGNNWFDSCLPTDVRDQVRAVYEQLMTGDVEPVEYYENVVSTKGGEERIIAWHNATLVDDGNIIGTLSSGEDITERKRAEQSLQESEERLRSITSAAHDAIVMINEHGRISFWNRSAETMFGYSSKQASGKPLHDLLAPDQDQAAIQEGQRRFRETGTGHVLGKVLGFTAVRSDGQVFPIELSVAPVRLRGKNHAVGIIRDISDRIRAEDARRRLETAIEQASEMVVITGTEGTIEYVNPAFERITGYTRDEAIGQNPSLLKSGRQDEAFYRELWNTVTSGEPWKGHLINRAKDGSLFEEEARISPVRDADGRITNFVAVKSDVTRETELETRLRQAQKMEAVGTLAGGIAHDFNNLLQAIVGYVDLARSTVPHDSLAFQYLGEVANAGDRATDLVNHILAFSREPEHERRPIRLQPVIDEALILLRASLPSTIEVQVDIDSECGVVLADPTEMHQMLMNLCTNAYHAMREDGGVLEVTLGELNVDAEQAILNPNLEPGRHAKLTVRDTGHGINKTTMERLFDPYFTTKKPHEGTGLGLATVLSIVKSVGGAINVDSDVGKGTTFEILLPLTKRRAGGEEAGVAKAATPQGKERVLLVDDEPAVAEIGKLGLEQLGYRVDLRHSSLEALEAFRFAPDRYDAIITDFTMPHMTGLELSREILSIRPGTPIILCTGFSELVDADVAAAVGIREYVRKPVRAQELARAVRRVLEEDRKPENV